MGVFQNNLMGAAAAAASAGGADFYDHQIANSVRLYRGGANSGSKLTRTPGSTGTSRRIYTLSTWIKRGGSGELGQLMTAQESSSTNYVDELVLRPSGENEALAFYGKGGNAGGASLKTNASLRDHSAWYHIMVAVDTTQGTDTNRVKIYLNGELQTLASTTYPAQNYDGGWGNNREMAIGWGTGANNGYPYDGLMAETIYIDGTAQAVTDLGESKNGVWIPKDPSELTFGDNGFWLKYESSSDLGNDSSGNNNDFSVTNIAAHDQMKDTPTFNSDSNGGNFATLGGLEKNTGGFTISEGNLKYAVSTNNRGFIASTGVPESGKYYWEVRVTQFGGSQDQVFPGVCVPSKMQSNLTGSRGGAEVSGAGGYTVDNYNGRAMLDGVAQSNDSIGTARSVPQTFGIAIDRDNNTFKWTYDGSTYSSTYTIPSTGVLAPYIGSGGGSNTASGVFNFGADSTFAGLVSAGGNADGNGYGDFSLAVPSGYVALCAANLPVADEVDPAQTDDDYPQELFSPVLYTGNGSSQSVTGVGFQPDWTWLKNRNSDQGHKLFDSTRGVTKVISSHNTDAQSTESGLSAFDSDGFSFSGSTVAGYNTSSNTYVAWNWRANGGTTSTNSNGSTNSTVQVDPSGHFSIVTFEGQNDSWGNAETIGHGLSSAPTCMILKNYDKVDEWSVFFSDYGGATIGGSNAASNSLVLNSNAALYTNQSYKGWGGVMPTSTVFTVDGNNNNGASESIIVYCFANCEGYIKSGAYEGNGSTDGTFVYTGFRPAFLMIKRVGNSANWVIFDTKRGAYNPTSEHLSPDVASQEYSGTSYELDILSNGFKLRDTWATINAGETYVFLAMAHNPFKYATAR